MYTSSQNAALAVSIVFSALALLSVLLRFVSRRIKNAQIKADDWFIVISLIPALANNIMVAWSAGVDALGVPIPSMSTATWVIYGKVLFIQPTIMMFNLTTIKISILFFYKRIFTTPRFFLVANILIATIAMWGIASILAQVFEQWPVSDNWTPSESGGKHFILNYADFNMAYSCLDLALDVIVLSLPMFMIRRLQLVLKKKLALAGIFLLGALSVIAEAVRIWLLWRILYGPNIKVILDGSLATNYIIWGTIEVCLSIIAASLPMLGPIFFDRKGPESIVRSVRSVFSLRSTGGGSATNAGRSKGSLTSSREDDSRRQWHELEERGQTTVTKNNATVKPEDAIYVKKTFQTTAEFEV
jgi:hypothetical protein